MTAESTDEMILADLLDVLCDFASDAGQCLNPWPDETLAPLRALAKRLRRWHRTFTLGDHRPRPQAVTIDPVAVLPEDTTITLTDARYLLPGDVIDFGGEVMEVTANPDVETGTVAVARGLRGTAATGHLAGAIGRLIGNTRTGHEVIYPPPPTVLSGPDRRRMRDAAERSRRVREDLDLTPDPSLCLNCHRRAVAEGAHLCAECSAHYVAYPETDGLTIRSRIPGARRDRDVDDAERAAFICPQCREEQFRVFPSPDVNYCNHCGADMGPPPAPAADARIDAALRRLEAETTEERARAEAGQPPCKFDTPEGRAELERMRRDLAEARRLGFPRLNSEAALRDREATARAEDITPPHLSRFARSVRAVIGTLGRVPALAEARRWVAVDLRDGALTSESAAERLRLLDELAGRAEGA